MGSDLSAFSVVLITGDQHREHVVAGQDLADAAATVQRQISSDARLVKIWELGELLAAPRTSVLTKAMSDASAPVISTPAAAAPVIHEAASASGQRQGGAGRRRKATAALQGSADAAPAIQRVPQRGTRRDQLLAVLRQHGAPVHLDAVAAALDIKRGHADEIARVAVKAGLVRRVGTRTGKVEVEQVGQVPAKAAPAKATPAPPSSRRAGPTRVEQLVALLRERGGPVHVTEIADALAVSRNNAGNVVVAALQAGAVRRVGTRTGKVELIDARKKESVPAAQPTPTPKKTKPSASPTRVERLAAFLETRQAAVHVTDIAEALSMTRGNVDSTVLAGNRAGLVRRVGSRTGMVELATPPGALEGVPGTPGDPGGTTTPAVLELLEAAQIDGIQRRVFDALVEMDGAVTAKEVAAQVGCRPREAGNALALLVEGGLVEREARTGTARSPSRYAIPTP